VESNTPNSQICVGLLVGSALLAVAFLGTAGVTLACLYYRREKVTGEHNVDEEKTLNNSLKPSPLKVAHYPKPSSRPPSPTTYSNYLNNNLVVPHNNNFKSTPESLNMTYIDSWDNYIAHIIPNFAKQTYELESVNEQQFNDDKIINESKDKNPEITTISQ
ncbi:2272_t:CDS:2, partial [Scutellospora calospora]